MPCMITKCEEVSVNWTISRISGYGAWRSNSSKLWRSQAIAKRLAGHAALTNLHNVADWYDWCNLARRVF